MVHLCHKGHQTLGQPFKIFDGHFTLLPSWDISVTKKWDGFLKKNALKRFLTPPASLSPDPHTLVKALWSPNVAALQSGSFPGLLMSSDQDHRVEDLYWPIWKPGVPIYFSWQCCFFLCPNNSLRSAWHIFWVTTRPNGALQNSSFILVQPPGSSCRVARVTKIITTKLHILILSSPWWREGNDVSQ